MALPAQSWRLAGRGLELFGSAVGCLLRRVARHPPVGFELTDEELARARRLLAAHRAIDAHAHPGRTFVRGAEGIAIKLRILAALGTFEEETVRDMRDGGLAAAVSAAVADFQVLDLIGGQPRAVRPFAEHEAWNSYRRQIDGLRRLAEHGLLRIALTPADLMETESDLPAEILAVEGADFLEGRLSRLADAYADGVRVITLVHFRTNEIGDAMTENPQHEGLTRIGADIVREMNRLGMIVDVAHASEATVRGVLDASSAPVMASHTHVRGGAVDSPRFISRELATAIADAGGLIGAWPAGIGISSLAGFVDRIAELADAVGIDHVCLGTDMDANYKPALDTYARLPWLVGGLLRRGFSEEDTAKILRGNFLRLFNRVCRA